MLSKVAKYTFASQSPVYIVAGKRTPIGTFLGKLSKIKATELGSIAIKGALNQANIPADQVDEVILGNVCAAGLGQSPARQASLGAGIPIGVPVTNINKVCASGMKTLSFGAQSIALGQNNVVVTGGFENMSQVPFYVNNHRKGHGFGNQTLVDGLATDGLTDVYNNIAMGLCAEKTSTDLGLDRQIQDDFAISSYERTLESIKTGRFKWEIEPVTISEKEGVLAEDEEPKRFQKDKMLKLRPAFSKTGVVTAANASKINDGACSIILMSEQKVKELGVTPLARIVSYADSEVDPIDFCIAPAKSGQRALERAGMKVSQIDYHEVNEAFSATALANIKLLDLDIDRVNIYGGAVALGHPIGMSGSRIVLNLVNILKNQRAKYGMAGICNGGGGATSIIIENLQ
ncbi:Thiolase-like protein [Pseudocohnilembus persalinus]|uniref:acetyl-CoA C-acetyltransferase n=1 Tax=Pseudocohnilembus persalinus TaxID=266149 RepID=A0A0V0R5R5_PSEPJ|nr:Thiolase-like protein [Pseudocohnilembus persalinus]|eukprot:KRX09839.1 Thiolase-like protein [Pseudocohnilembus persalinus]